MTRFLLVAWVALAATVLLSRNSSFALPIVATPTPTPSPSATQSPSFTNTIHPIPAPSPSTPGYFQIHPVGAPDRCLLYEPAAPGINGTLKVTTGPCSATYSALHIAQLDGSPWDGKNSTDVIIAAATNQIGCMENPLRPPQAAPIDPLGSDGITATWYPCATGQGTDPLAQRFFININGPNTGGNANPGNPLAIHSALEFALGYPNPKLECLTEYGPYDIRWEPCANLRNWYATPALAPSP